LGRNPVGPKLREGDKRTPEGLYAIESHNPRSSFHRALKVSYPSAADRIAAAKRGVAPGGDIMIHGIRNGLGFIGRLQRRLDWTAGCIAVTNPEIEEIYRAVPDGTPIEIRP
jgi:murein L,D-transpeptidase YafK